MFGDAYYDAPRRYATQSEERAGGARSDPAVEFRGHAGLARGDARPQRSAGLRADLEAHDGVADGGRTRAAHRGRDFRRRPERRDGDLHRVRQGDRVCRLPPRLRRRQRRSGGRARGAGDRAAEADGRRTRRAGAGGARARGGARTEASRHGAAGAVHRSVAHQGARAARHRPAVDLRVDDRDHRAPRLRLPAGQGARAQLHGVRRHAPAVRSLQRSRRRRVHRRDGRGSRSDLARRARLARLHPRVLPWRQAPSRPRGRGQTGGRARRLSVDRRRRGPGLRRDHPRAHRTLRSVPPAGRGRARQDRVAAADAAAGRPDGREGDGADSREGRGSASARRRSEDRPAGLRDSRPFRRLRAARRNAAIENRRRSPSARRSPTA